MFLKFIIKLYNYMMALSTGRQGNSMETILNFDNRDTQSQWSEVWSTSQIPGMDQAAGAGGVTRLRALGRRRLRCGSLALGSLLTMHCRVAASALTGGFFIFLLFLVVAVAALANPLRHFEVYVGQWSMSGPGRAFRIVPLFDGIGFAMCLNSVFRAINSCTSAALTASYVLDTVKDDQLPFTFCRDFDYNTYDAEAKAIQYYKWKTSGFVMDSDSEGDHEDPASEGHRIFFWKNYTRIKTTTHVAVIAVCNDTYPPPYPELHITPPYNYLYVQVAGLRPGYDLTRFNWTLFVILMFIWLLIWFLMIWERVSYGRLIWNNMPQWVLPVPWIWTIFMIIIAVTNLTFTTNLQDILRIGAKEIVAALTDAFEVALYIHSASLGTELITGKGMNYFASGHIDPAFNKENVMHSGLLVLLTTLHSAGATLCSLVDSKQANSTSTFDYTHESTFWVLGMYSRCTSQNRYSHTSSTLLFLGLTCSYITVAYVMLKTALHIIFEYRVKLVFIEQAVVGVLVVFCAFVSIVFATHGGLVLLECTEALLTGVVTPLICALELVALLYVYRSHDFMSDANVAMEESSCSGRIAIQWQIIPVITIVTLITKITVFLNTTMPLKFILLGAISILCVILAMPARALFNMYAFMHPKTQRNA